MDALRRWAAGKTKKAQIKWLWLNPKKRGKPGEDGYWEEYDKETTAELEHAFQACCSTLRVRLLTPAIEYFEVDLHKMEQTSEDNPRVIYKVRREGHGDRETPQQADAPQKKNKKKDKTEGKDKRPRSESTGKDGRMLRGSDARLLAKSEREEEEEFGTRREEEAEEALTRAKAKGKERIVQQEPSEDIGVNHIEPPVSVFSEWTKRDIAEELFFYPDDMSFMDPDGLLSLVKEQEKKFSSWKRLSSFHPPPKMLIGDGLSPYAVTQSSVLGDCAFLATLCAGANHKLKFGRDLISPNVQPQNEKGVPVYNPSGKYAFRFFWNGAFRKVIVDDFLPVDSDERPLCSYSTNKSEVFVPLIEKAYMKVKGNAYIHGTHAASDMQILFGFIPQPLSLTDFLGSEAKTDMLWRKIEKNFREGKCLLVFATGGLSEFDLDPAIPSFYRTSHPTGLLPFHAYACLDVRSTPDGDRLVKLKNPWAAQRWRGKWSEYDHESWTEEMQNFLDFDLSAQHYFDNGVFWISWEDLLEYYSELHIGWDPDACHSDQRIMHGIIPELSKLIEKDATLVESPWWNKGASHLHQLDGLVVMSQKVDLYIDPRSYVHSPQFVLVVEPPHQATIQLLLTRHHAWGTHHLTSHAGSVDSYKSDDYMTLHIFENGGRRVNDIFDSKNLMIHEGRFLSGDNYFVELDLPPAEKRRPRTFTVLVCHREVHHEFPFSLRVFAPFEVEDFRLLPSEKWDEEEIVHGKWENHKKIEGSDAFISTAGGTVGGGTYLLNPMYLISFKPSHGSSVHFQASLSGISLDEQADLYVNLSLLPATKSKSIERIHYLTKNPPIATTGPYRPDYCVLRHTLSAKDDTHEVVAVPSTNVMGLEAAFTLTVQTNQCPVTITPIPNLGEGDTIVTHFEGIFLPDDPGQEGGPLNNPRLEFKTTAKTSLCAYITLQSEHPGPVPIRLCIYDHKKKKTVGGKFSEAPLRLLAASDAPLKAGAHLSVVAVTAHPVPQPVVFDILLFSTAPLQTL